MPASPNRSPARSCDLPASMGVSRIMGTTITSWKMSMAEMARPCGAPTVAFSCSSFSTMAVLESANRKPRNNAEGQGMSHSRANSAVIPMVPSTCAPPPMNTTDPSVASVRRLNSMPITKSRKMTPTSASSSTSWLCGTRPSPCGPKIAPVARKPSSVGSLKRRSSSDSPTASPRISTTSFSRGICMGRRYPVRASVIVSACRAFGRALQRRSAVTDLSLDHDRNRADHLVTFHRSDEIRA